MSLLMSRSLLVAVIVIQLAIVVLLVAATADARTLTWADTFDRLAEVFKDSPYHRGALVNFMFRTSPRDINYADRLCDSLDFVRCLGFEGASKGSSSAPAWPIQITVRNRYHRFAYADIAAPVAVQPATQEQRAVEQVELSEAGIGQVGLDEKLPKDSVALNDNQQQQQGGNQQQSNQERRAAVEQQELSKTVIGKTAIEQVHYDKLPDNAHVLRLECGNHNDYRAGEEHSYFAESVEEEDALFDMAIEDVGSATQRAKFWRREKILRSFAVDATTAGVLAKVSPTLRELQIDGCSVRSSGASGGAFRGVSTLFETLVFSHSVLQKSFIDSGAAVFAGVLKRFDVFRSGVEGGAHMLSHFVAEVGASLEELSVRSVDVLVDVSHERQHRTPLQVLPILEAVSKSKSSSSSRLRSLELETFVGFHDHHHHHHSLKEEPASVDAQDKDAVNSDAHALSGEQQRAAFSHIKALSALEHLRIVNVPFTQAPPEVSPLCRSLHIVGGKLAQFPDLVSQNQAYPLSLEEVDFSGNAISSFAPDDSTIPRHVRRVRIAHNKLVGTLSVDSIARHLQELNISHNQLSGSVDFTKIGERMAVFDLSFNAFTGPVNLRQLPESLRVLDLSNNNFTGRYDVTKLPLLSTMISFGENNWDSLMPPRRGGKNKNKKKKRKQPDL